MTDSPKPSRSLLNIAKIVAIATLISKVFGLVRQQAIGAAFGSGPAYGAYNFAYVIPGFLLILLGGINGPFHSAIVSVLSKRQREEAGPILETITTLVVGVLALVTIGLIIFAEPLTRLVAPGLFVPNADAMTILTRQSAIQQFQIMAPMAVLAGLIGLGFGALNAADDFWLPSISPLFSSAVMIVGLGGLAIVLQDKIYLPENAMLGGTVLAWTTLLGAVLQWLVQLPAQRKAGLGGLRLRFDFQRPEVKEVMQVMLPATFASGMMQINVWTDLIFASFIPNPAAAVSAMGYASLLVLTPLGILSNAILVPLLPAFSRAADPERWGELKELIRKGLLMTAALMLPVGGLMMALALPMSRVVYERYGFTVDDSYLTASVLVAYASGMFFYLGRDVLVRVFYALGDAETPFRISVLNIFFNALLDFVFVKPFGAPGLILATVGVNIISMVMLLAILHRRLNGLTLWAWSQPILKLLVGSAIAAGCTWGSLLGLRQVLGDSGFWMHLIHLCVGGGVGILVFAAIVSQLRLPEVDELVDRLRQRLLKKSS